MTKKISLSIIYSLCAMVLSIVALTKDIQAIWGVLILLGLSITNMFLVQWNIAKGVN